MTEQERDALFQEAEKQRTDGDYESAQPRYEQILAEDGTHLGARMGLGHCLLNTGLFDEALVEYERAVNQEPDNLLSLLTYGKGLCMLGMYPEAKAQFKRVLEIDPDNEDAMEQMLYFPDDDE